MDISFLEKLTHQSEIKKAADEFKKKYIGTYLVCNNVPIAVLYVTFRDKIEESYINDDTVRVYPFSGITSLEVVFPKQGFFTYNGRLYLGAKKPERQYVWGVCPSNFEVKDMIHFIADMANNYLDINTYTSALDENHYNLTQELLDSPILGFSLSASLGVTIHPVETGHLIWYHSVPIARIIGGEIIIKVSAFKQELLDYMRNYKVKGFTVHG
jgi:hypothetical protein